jgi:hypothetical protein
MSKRVGLRFLMGALVTFSGAKNVRAADTEVVGFTSDNASTDVIPITLGAVESQLVPRESPAAAFNKLLEKHYSSCRRVFTGNGRGGRDQADPQYMAALGLNFLRQSCRCEDSPIKKALIRPLGNGNDVLTQARFQVKSSLAEGHEEDQRLVNLYAILFTLGQRESSGNFAAGKDGSAQWFASTAKKRQWEAGVFQLSADSLTLDGVKSSKTLPNTEPLPKQIFVNYLKSLVNASPSDQQLICDLNILGGSKDSPKSKSDGSGLHRLFNFFGNCRAALVRAQKMNQTNLALGLNSTHDNTVDCFRSLQQECPAFAIEYTAVVSRINRRHWGPLLKSSETRVDKPYLVPGCTKFFEELVLRKNEFCELNNARAEIPTSVDLSASATKP